MSSEAVLPAKNEAYGTQEYWDERYQKEQNVDSFDWFKSYQEIANLIRQYVPDKKSRILMLGCGNSSLSEEMYDDGYTNVVNVDYSSVVIQQMKAKHERKRPEMEWHEMDVRSMAFEDNSFDVAIDKGTMDAMMTLKGDVWDPPEQVVKDCNMEVDEVLRVLKPGTGTFLYITFGQPHFRRRYLTRTGTTLEVKEFGDMFHYYLYALRT